MTFIRNFSRIIIGLIFIFSGFVKGIDPLGTAYRIEDYFIAYGTEWAMPLALFLSVSLSALEFLLGVILVLNVRIRFFSWPLFLLVIFFIFLTLYDAVYEPVPDCGCFGDVFTISNWNTFYKNLILIIFVSIIFVNRKDFRSPFSIKAQNAIGFAFASIFVIFSVYNYQHLPIIDFREWKTGNDMVPEEQGSAKIYLTFRNVESGETKEYLSPDYPWKDSIWMENWEFVDQRIDESGLIKGHELMIEDEEGLDVTENFINNPNFQMLLIAYDLGSTDEESFKDIEKLFKQGELDGCSLIIVTSSLPEDVKEFRKNLDPNIEFYYADDVVLKTMIRANPGLMLMKDAVVMGKWHFNDMPSYEQLRIDYFHVIHD